MYKIWVSCNPLNNGQQILALSKLISHHSDECKNGTGLIQGCTVCVVHLNGSSSGPHYEVYMVCTKNVRALTLTLIESYSHRSNSLYKYI